MNVENVKFFSASSAAEVRPREERRGSAGGAQTRARPHGETRPLPLRDEQVRHWFDVLRAAFLILNQTETKQLQVTAALWRTIAIVSIYSGQISEVTHGFLLGREQKLDV